MRTKPLEVLKAGLTRLKEQIKTCKDTLTTRLFNKECISNEDEHWLDNEANFVLNTLKPTAITDFFTIRNT